jgi:hypothetical protein
MKSNWVTGRTNLRRWGATSSAAGSAASACSNQRKYGLSPQANIPNKNRREGGKGWRRTARCAERRRKKRTACRTLLQAAACRLPSPHGSRRFRFAPATGKYEGLGPWDCFGSGVERREVPTVGRRQRGTATPGGVRRSRRWVAGRGTTAGRRTRRRGRECRVRPMRRRD